jgi:Mycothiol maleylpyruvate isomerase N-terminal domain
MSHSMMHTSMLRQEELRIFEELISRFDSLSEAEMSVVGVTPEWSAKDLLAHLAYWERAAAEEIREFEAGRWPAKKRTRGQMERIKGALVSAKRATPRHLLREELILARTEIAAAMGRAPRNWRKGLRSLTSFTLTAYGTGGITWNNFALGFYVLAKHCERQSEVRFIATATFVETGSKKLEACRFYAPRTGVNPTRQRELRAKAF